MLVHIEPGP